MDAMQIAACVAESLADGSADGPPDLDWDDTRAGRGKHDRRIPGTSVILHGGMRVELAPARDARRVRKVTVISRDGHRQEYPHGETTILKAWSEFQARHILHELSETVPMPVRRGRLSRLFGDRRGGVTHGPAATHLSDVVAQCIEDMEPVRCEETYRVHFPATGISEFLGAGAMPARTENWRSDWRSVGFGLRILRSGEYTGTWLDHDQYMVAHENWGVVCVPAALILGALERRRNASFASSLPPNTVTLTAEVKSYAEKLVAIGRRALAVDPNLRDPGGARIDALVERHLPRLLSAHADAVRLSPSDRTRLDDELAHGLGVVKKALEQSMDEASDAARNQLLTEVRFLEMRHPNAAGLT